MGTDIHMAAERKDAEGIWHAIAPTSALQEMARKEYARWLAPESTDAQMRAWAERKVLTSWYDDRNYEAFAILADVRNGTGFAGIDTGDGFKIIAEPRGLPLDLSAELRNASNYDAMRECGLPDVPEDPPGDDALEDALDKGFWLGDHSYSWLTAQELQDFDWLTQVTTLRGVVGWNEFAQREQLGETGSPESYSGSVWSRYAVTLPQEVARTVLLPGGLCDMVKVRAIAGEYQREDRPSWLSPDSPELPRDVNDVHVRVSWNETYAEAAGRFHSIIIPELLSVDPDPSNVRIVFGFDS